MSCNVPINIVRQQTDKCKLKCNLWYNYGNSSCILKNNEDNLAITYDGESDVMFNSDHYKPTEIRIFKPSIHSYDGEYADGEIIIAHSGGRNGLLICIPIIVSKMATTLSKGTTLIEDIIKYGTTSSEVSTLNIQDFNANDLIPKSPYFSYTGPLPYGTCMPDTNAQYVVFHYKHGSIPISETSINTLGNLIHDSFISIHEGKSFFNEKGTTENGVIGDGIWMDCQPTDEDSEMVHDNSNSTKPMNLEWLWSILFVVLGICLAILLKKLVGGILGNIKNIPLEYAKPVKT